MAGTAVLGATERDARDFPHVYPGNLCGLRATDTVVIEGGSGGMVVHPLCLVGETYEDGFVAPLTGELWARVMVGEVLSGTTAVLAVEIDGSPVGELDLLSLSADTPTEMGLESATVIAGESVITVRTECSDDVSPGAGLALTLGAVDEDE